jgi:branched-subunit amino acid aminotransferase/4-amino-4-deoxychorismate lyase
VIWPSALSLEGITMQLVSTALAERGIPFRRETVRVADLHSFRSAFLTNSLGVAPVRQVDDQILSADPGFIRDVVDAYESLPWDQI